MIWVSFESELPAIVDIVSNGFVEDCLNRNLKVEEFETSNKNVLAIVVLNVPAALFT